MHTSLRHGARLAFLLSLAITATSAPALASTSETWDGSVNSWSQAAHWSPAAVPNNGTPPGTTYAASLSAGQVNLDINATIDSLTFTGGTLNDTLGNSLTVLGTTTIHNATLQFGSSTASGAHGTFGSVDNFGTFTTGYFTGGNNTVSTSTSFTNEAGATTFINAAGDVANFHTFTNLGHLLIGFGATLNITGGGTGVTDVPQNSQLQASGIFNVINGGTPSSALGHLATLEGDLQIANQSTADLSAITISSAGALELTGNQTFSTPTITNSGAVNLGYFAGANNTLTVSGAFINTATGTLRLANAGDILNVASLTNSGTIQMNPGETLNITGGGTGVTDIVQGSTYSIAGAVNVINGGTPSSAFSHTATIEGDLHFGTGLSIADAASISVSSTGNLELVGNQTFSTPAITNSGSVNLGYFATGNNTLTITGTLTNTPTGAVRLANSGDTVNVGSLINQGYISTNSGETLNITGGGNGVLDVVQGATFVLGGPFNVINGNVTSSALGHLASIEGDLRLSTGGPLADAAAITLSTTGALELTGNQTFSAPNINNSGGIYLGYFATGNNTLTISGTFTNSPTGTLHISNSGDTVNVGTLVNQGFIQMNAGEVLNITGGGPGITTIVAGSTIQLGGSINVINSGVPSNALANLTTIAGSLQLLNGQSLNVGNVSIASTGQLWLGNASTLIAGNITNSGFLATSSFTSTGNTLTITGALTNNAGATFNIQSGDTTSIANLKNTGIVNINANATLPLLNGGAGTLSLNANGTVLTLNGGSSQNVIHDSNQFGVSGALISNNNVQTGPLQLASVTIFGHHKITLPGSRINSLTLQGSTGNWTSGLDLAPFANTILEDSVTHNTTLARTLDQVHFGLTHANGIYSSTLAANERLVVIDNATLPSPFSSFGGQPADAGSILLMPTYLGDATLDGKVDLNDLNTVLNHLGVTTPLWTNGNFDGAATIDLNDLNAVLNNLGLSSPAPTAALIPATASPVPEPASLATIGAAFGLLTLRVRRKR